MRLRHAVHAVSVSALASPHAAHDSASAKWNGPGRVISPCDSDVTRLFSTSRVSGQSVMEMHALVVRGSFTPFRRVRQTQPWVVSRIMPRRDAAGRLRRYGTGWGPSHTRSAKGPTSNEHGVTEHTVLCVETPSAKVKVWDCSSRPL